MVKQALLCSIYIVLNLIFTCRFVETLVFVENIFIKNPWKQRSKQHLIASRRSRKLLNVKTDLNHLYFFLFYVNKYMYLEGKDVPTELRKMDKASKEDFGFDQAQEGKKNQPNPLHMN